MPLRYFQNLEEHFFSKKEIRKEERKDGRTEPQSGVHFIGPFFPRTSADQKVNDTLKCRKNTQQKNNKWGEWKISGKMVKFGQNLHDIKNLRTKLWTSKIEKKTLKRTITGRRVISVSIE